MLVFESFLTMVLFMYRIMGTRDVNSDIFVMAA